MDPAEFMADPARAKLAKQLVRFYSFAAIADFRQAAAWEGLDENLPEGFFESAQRSLAYQVSAPEGGMALYSRGCWRVDFFGPGDSYPYVVMMGSGKIRVPEGVSVQIFSGVVRWF